MDPLTLIGAFLALFGLLVFSLKLMAYNRRKYRPDTEAEARISDVYHPGRSPLRWLALAILLVALMILFLFHR
jgi:hypothetical protein